MFIGFARIPYANLLSDFVDSTTSEKLFSEFVGSLQSTSASKITVIGRFGATLSAGAGYTWSVPTFTVNNLIQRPIYETRELNWSPQYTGFSTAPSGVTAKYKVRDDFVRTNILETNNGTSNSTSKSISFPFRSRSSVTYGALINTIDNGTQGYGKFLFGGGSNTPSVFPNLTSPTWTASGSCRIETLGVTIEYGI